MKYVIGILDDENIYRDKIRDIVVSHLNEKELSNTILLFENHSELFEKIKDIDILFLDVEMDSMNGIEIKDRLSKYIDLRIIFVSNYLQYMDEAYGKNVIRFIKKDKLDGITNILDRIIVEDSNYQYIKIADQKINSYDIEYIKADGSYSTIYTSTKEIMVCKYLKNVLELLPNYFIQTHRSYVINLHNVKSIQNKDILLDNNVIVPIARGNYEKVMKTYHQFIRSKVC